MYRPLDIGFHLFRLGWVHPFTIFFHMVTINGQSVEAAGKSVAQYLAEAGYNTARIAVERNEEIVPKAKYADTIFADGDVVEVVNFVGGG